MFELARELLAELDAGRSVVAVTVARVDGSAPRALGSTMLLTGAGAVVGSISGGCVEADAYQLARETQADGVARGSQYGYDDAAALKAGLSCGGRMGVLARAIGPGDAVIAAELRAVAAGQPAGLALVVEGPAEWLGLAWSDRGGFSAAGSAAGAAGHDDRRAGFGAALGDALAAALGAAQAAGAHRRAALEVEGVPVTALLLVAAPPPRLLIFGALDFSAALAAAAKPLGYRVTVCDARELFATAERMPAADEVVAEWPDEYLAAEQAAGRIDARSVLIVLTHDAKFDVPVLLEALAGPAGYLGAMGSRRTHEDRLRRLREAGAAPEQLARLRSPLGLDLGAVSPEETAISILAEVLALRSGASTRPLGETSGPIHPR